MTISVGDMIRLSMIGDHQGLDEVVQSYQFRMISGSPLSDDLAMGDIMEVLEALWIIISQFHAISTVFRRLKGQDIVSSRLLPEQTFSPVLAGTVAGDEMPSQVMFPLSFTTTTPRVLLRKMYGPTADSIINVDGFYSAGTLQVAGAAAVFLLSPMLGTLATWEYGYDSPVALTWVVPSGSTFSNIPGSLRRRRVGVGS